MLKIIDVPFLTFTLHNKTEFKILIYIFSLIEVIDEKFNLIY